ncbi:hypothetical protein K474DRAFT_1774197 [Panus rudis PR-1116 ss-1]|nr:hypothetical protein K474DRAFT_1774197 [Panus rudis PR-1116 ss-1]
MINFALLGVCVSIVVVLILYLFYFNRFLGLLLSLLCRVIFWNQGESSIWVDIGSIHFSIIAGRVLFKNLRYYSANQSIFVVKGQLSWRYWLRSPAEEDDLSHAGVIGEGIRLKQKAPLSCRVHLSLQGLEWLIYNRTAAFDNIISSMEASAESAPEEEGRPSGEGRVSIRKMFSRTSGLPDASLLGPPGSLISSLARRTPTFVKRASAWIRSQLPSLDPRDLLPISLEASTAAITCGNPSTPQLLVAEFQRAQGTYGVVPARSKHDFYKQHLNLTFKDASIRFVENGVYRHDMVSEGERVHSTIQETDLHVTHHISYLSFPIFQKVWRHMKLWKIITTPLTRPNRGPMFPHPAATWNRRKSRKLEEDATPVGADFSHLEYAKEPKILECPSMELLYYADVPGVVPTQPEPTAALDPFDIGNGDLSPEWGLDLALNGGSIRYGPWADRQRVHLQRAFFPQTFLDTTPNPPLKPGDERVWTHFKLFIELREGVVLQVPFREASKNWQWDGIVEVPNRPKVREGASIHVKAGDTSSISYLMPMIANNKGYEPTLEVHLDTVTVTTSLNDIRLLNADSCRIRCDMPSPLRWNEQRQWTYAITLRQPVIYLLRDHVNMLADLGKDWSSGPPSDYFKFIPMHYQVEVDMQSYEINTYVNDHNIIDKPLTKEENALLTLHGPRLYSHAQIPLTKFRPDSTAVAFDIDASSLQVRLSLPKWNTHSLFSIPHQNDLGRIGHLHLDGSYRYYADVLPENIDQLRLDFAARDVAYKVVGWSIRHLMILRDNYFGTFTHFSTLVEYLQRKRTGRPVGDPIDLQYREGSSNALQVQLSLDLDYGLMIMPAGLPGYEYYNLNEAYNLDDMDIGAATVLVVPTMQLQLRTHEYYMEMSLVLDTVYGHVVEHCSDRPLYFPMTRWSRDEQFILDGLHIAAHRLYGPQPHTTTYLCIWEIKVGNIRGILSCLQGRILQASGSTLGLTYGDPLNAPAAGFAIPPEPDITFWRFSLGSLNLVWSTDGAAIELQLPNGMQFASNDVPGKLYAKVSSVKVPQIILKGLLASGVTRTLWNEAINLSADCYVDIYSAPSGWRAKAAEQIAFVKEQDSATGRAQFLYDPVEEEDQRRGTKVPSRALIDAELYLPCLRIPRHRKSTRPTAGGPKRYSTASQRTRLGPYPVHLYESDEEDDYVSQADRDIRLVKSKPARPAFSTVEEESMGSGEESDNDDMTDFETDSDDYSYDENSDTGPLIKEYSRWISRYSSYMLARPSLWDTSPFIYRKLPNLPQCHYPIPQSDDFPQGAEIFKAYGVDQDADSTTFRIAFRRELHVQVTPLITAVAKKFAHDISVYRASPELQIDAIIARRVNSLSSKNERLTCLSFDLDLSSLHIQVIQSHSRWKEGGTDSQGIPIRFSSGTCIHVYRWHAKGQFVTDPDEAPRVALFSRAGDVAVQLRDLTDSYAARSSVQAVHCFSARHGSIALDGRTLIVSCGRTDLEFDHAAPELARTSILSLLQHSREIASIMQQSFSSLHELDRQTIYHIVKFCEHQNILDPLSAFQPSYLIQSGRPRAIRTDVTFKFLIYLRNCLQQLEPNQRRKLLQLDWMSVDPVPVTEVKDIVNRQLLQAGNDIELSESTLEWIFPDVFQTKAGNADAREPQKQPLVDTIILHSVRFRLRLRHDLTTRSEFRIDDVALRATTRVGRWVSPTVLSRKNATLITEHDEHHRVRQIVLSLSLGDITFIIHPQLLQFAQVIIAAFKPTSVNADAGVNSRDPDSPVSRTSQPVRMLLVYVDILLSVKSFRVRAIAEKLLFDYKASSVSYVCGTLLDSARPMQSLSTNNTLTFDEILLQACTVADKARAKEHKTLAMITLSDGKLNVLFRADSRTNHSADVVMSLGGIHLNVPRSAMRLYRFAEEWKADYLPGLEATMRALLSELNSGKAKPPSATSPPSVPIAISMHAKVTSLRVSLQVMYGTWLGWEISQGTMYFLSPTVSQRKTRTFGAQIGSQSFSISSRTKQQTSQSIQVKLDLPTFSVTGHFDGHYIRSLAMVEFFHFTIKPSHWDTLLTVQQKFGSDFNDLVSLVEETRRKKDVNPRPSKPRKSIPQWQYDVNLRMQGFRIGLQGVSSTVFLECENINARVKEGQTSQREFRLFDLALSLAPRAGVRPDTSFDRGHRSAFVILDFQAEMRDGASSGKRLDISVTKTHAVMQPSSIGELGDFIDHLQAEIATRKEKRANELAEFREKTRSVMRTFDVKLGESQPSDTTWWDEYIIKIDIRNVGIVFPLALDTDLGLPRSGSTNSSSVRAFLFSVKSVQFGTQKGESGQITIRGFSFQFVSSFKQADPSHFLGESHQTKNRLAYPEMKAHLRMERVADSRRIRIGADVDGFIFDIDPTMPDYIFSLIAVYRQGKERVERLAGSAPKPDLTGGPSQSENHGPSQADYNALLTSNILASMTFASGTVRMHNKAVAPHSSRSKSISSSLPDAFEEHRPEIFNLPVVSVWGEYRATPASMKTSSTSQAREPSVLLFKSTIHSSQNTLRPTLLPFLTDLVKRVEAHMRKSSSTASEVPRPPTPSDIGPDEGTVRGSSITAKQIEDVAPAVGSMQISLSLRIDQSKLELTCQPDVNVVAGLHWDSGGFVVNISPGARRVTFTGSVGGLTAGLKHGFLSDDCVRLDARNLAFTVNFAKVDRRFGRTASSVSVVVDTEFSGGVRFSRLQDVLCFKAVWLDRIPMMTAQNVPAPMAASRSTSHFSAATSVASQAPKEELITAVLLRMRSIKLDVDLGQSITMLELRLHDALMRTKLSELSSEVFFTISDISVLATGNLSGKAHVPDFRFQTVRRNEHGLGEDMSGWMLNLSMTSGPLEIELESEYRKLLLYRAEPIEVMIYDDWSKLAGSSIENRRVGLVFTVSGSEVVAILNVGTIPRLVSYANKFKANLEAQREGASRESTAFKISFTPQPDNPLSAVANAMLNSAKTRMKEAEIGLTCVVEQRMSLKLDTLRLVVFPRSMRDMEAAHFIGSDVHARLDRIVESDLSPASRQLHLSFSSMAISRMTQLNHSLVSKEQPDNTRDRLKLLMRGTSEATIFGLPSMKIWMKSEETMLGAMRTLVYDFSSTFNAKGTSNRPEDIYITLNMQLYSWLTVLRKTFTREMEQVQAAADVSRNSTGGIATSLASIQRSKKPPEILLLAPEKSNSLDFPSEASKFPPRPGAPMAHSRSFSLAIPSSARTDDLSISPTPSAMLPSPSPTSSSISPSARDDSSTIAIGKSPLHAEPSEEKSSGIIYKPRSRHIERLTMRQLGEATPDVMHPFFMKKAGFSLEDSLPQYVHEYATMPTEEIMKALLKLYSRQLKEPPTELHRGNGA